MDHYIGIDAHLKSCTVAIMSSSGRRIRQDVLETDAQVLQAYIKRVPGNRHICFEEGLLSEWLYETLESLCDELVVVQPESPRVNKNDSVDAWGLAEDLRLGRLPRAVFKAPRRYTQLRTAVRTYDRLVRDCARTKKRLKAAWGARGIHCEGNELYLPETRKPYLKLLRPPYRQGAELLAEEHDRLAEVVADADEWLVNVARRTPEVVRLTTVPGIGHVRAAQVVATVVTPHRFRTHGKFRNYCGLGIVSRTSSDYVRNKRGVLKKKSNARTRGLNRNCNRRMKNVFKGAAKSVIGTKEGKLVEGYRQLVADGMKPNLALLTIARRIAAITLAIWKNGEDYDPEKHS